MGETLEVLQGRGASDCGPKMINLSSAAMTGVRERLGSKFQR
jgi:hypothetical protein